MATYYTIEVDHDDYGDSYTIIIEDAIRQALANVNVEGVDVRFMMVTVEG